MARSISCATVKVHMDAEASEANMVDTTHPSLSHCTSPLHMSQFPLGSPLSFSCVLCYESNDTIASIPDTLRGESEFPQSSANL